MASEYVGNIIPAPGHYIGDTLDDPELLYSTARFTQKGVTLAPGMGVLPIGTVMAQRTADLLWVAYNGAGTGGVNVARGILRTGSDTGTDPLGRVYQGNIVISGILKNALVKGADAAAVAAFAARVDTVLGIFVF